MRLAIIALLALGGCATTQTVWVRDGATQQDFSMDQGMCQAQAFSVPGALALQVALVYSSCMRGKGWHQETRPV